MVRIRPPLPRKQCTSNEMHCFSYIQIQNCLNQPRNLSIVEDLQNKGVAIVQKERLDTGTPQGRFMLTVFAALAELERESIFERQAEGIAIAKQQGRMGRPAAAITPVFISAYKRWKAGELTAFKAMKEAGMSKSVWYRKVQEYESKVI